MSIVVISWPVVTDEIGKYCLRTVWSAMESAFVM